MSRPRRRITAPELLEARRVPAAISVAPVQVTEAGTATQATFTATLDAATTDPVTLTYATANGTARAGRDYAATKSTVTIPAGETSATFTVPILASDVAGKATERFFLNLKTTAGNTLASRRVAATIIDGNAAPTVTVSDATVVEPASGGSKTASVVVSLSNPSARAVRVSYATLAGTAASSEFQARSGTVTIRPYTTSVRVPVRVYGNATSDETVNVALRSATNASLSTATPGATYGRVVIQDSALNGTRPTITVSSPTVTAGDTAVFTVSLSSASTLPVSFRYATAGTTDASVDYAAANDVVTIPAGQTTATIAIPTTNTVIGSGSEQLTLKLSGAANGVLASSSAVATIQEQATVSAANVAATATPNTASTVAFTVTIAAGATAPVLVGYNTVDGTAVAGTDYTPTSGFLVFQPGVTSLTVPVTLPAEANPPATATFSLNLFGTSGTSLATATATITSTGGMGTPPTGTPPTGTPPAGTPPGTTSPAITVAAGSAVVGTTGTATLAFTVTLTSASTSTVTVDYATLDGSAVAGTDYTAASGTLTFAPGTTSQTVNVIVNGENTTATSKSLSLLISNATNATITSNSITGNITYATGTPTVAVSSPSTSVGTSGSGTLTFTVTLSAVSAEPVTVAYSTADGTAVAGTDYTATSGTLTFAAGDTSMTVAVPIAGESGTTASKTVLLNLSGATNTSNATASGTGTINYVVAGQSNVLSSNITNASGGVETSTGTTYNAASFSTGTSAYTLNSVDLLLASTSGTATVEILTDTANQPGTLVGTLTSPSTYATTATSTAFTSTAGIALAANSTYWVVLIANTGSFDWSWTSDDTDYTGVGYTDSWAQTTDGGSTYFSYNTSPTQMTVNATPTS